jgi:hypothetical protein
MQLFTTQGQLANVLDTGSRPASFASLSSAGNVVKLGFTSATNTTSAITRALASHTVFEPVSGFETVSEEAGDDQVQFSKLPRTAFCVSCHSCHCFQGLAVATAVVDSRIPLKSPTQSLAPSCSKYAPFPCQMEQGQFQ